MAHTINQPRMNAFGMTLGMHKGFGAAQSQGGGAPVTQTTLRRESDGTVTVLSLAKPFTPNLIRQSDGTVTVGA